MDLHNSEVAIGTHVTFMPTWYIISSSGFRNNFCDAIADLSVSIFGDHRVVRLTYEFDLNGLQGTETYVKIVHLIFMGSITILYLVGIICTLD